MAYRRLLFKRPSERQWGFEVLGKQVTLCRESTEVLLGQDPNLAPPEVEVRLYTSYAAAWEARGPWSAPAMIVAVNGLEAEEWPTWQNPMMLINRETGKVAGGGRFDQHRQLGLRPTTRVLWMVRNPSR